MNGYTDCQTCKSFNKSIFCNENARVITNILSGDLISISYKKGQNIYSEGTLGQGVYCIQKGKVKVYKICEGRNIVTDLGVDGDLLGFSNIINEGKCVNSAKCFEDSQVCFIPKKVFMVLLETKTPVVFELLKNIARENNRLSNFIGALKCKNTEQRIADTLFLLEKKFGIDKAGYLDISLTRKDISEISGTTTESAIRILNEFKRDSAIDILKSKIKILDKNKLRMYKS